MSIEVGKYDKYGSVGSPNREQAIIDDLQSQIGQPEVVFVYSKLVALTDGQFKSLPTSRQLIIPPPTDSSLTIIIDYFLYKLNAENFPYTNIENSDASTMSLVYGENYNDDASEIQSNLYTPFNQEDKFFRIPARGTLAIGGLYRSDVVGQGVYLNVNNGALGNFTGGNNNNTLTVVVSYSYVKI